MSDESSVMPRVYLCDDQREYRMLLKAVINSEEGMEVVGEGGDGAACLRDATKHDPDVILLDQNMPGRSGLDTLPELKELVPDAAVIMLSTAAAEECEEEALRRGATGFISKPHNIFDLPGMIRGKLEDAGLAL